MGHTRVNPPDIYQPRRYSQVVTSSGVTQWHIAGTVGFDQDRELVSHTDMRAQTAATMENLQRTLDALGITPAHVVRINVYTVDMGRFRIEASDLVYDFFTDHKPASTLIAVPRLANPGYLVEVEATAVAYADAPLPSPQRLADPHERLNPFGMYQPNRGAYSQVVTSTGTTQWHLAGMVALDASGTLVGENDMRVQAVCVMENIRRALATVGAIPAHVVRINTYTVDMDRFRAEAGAVVFGFFGNTRPASTLAAVTRLADPRYLLEVEATAVSAAAT
ncbi:MAG: RidA family protein [Candidatus Tectomicrobia bacterium]